MLLGLSVTEAQALTDGVVLGVLEAHSVAEVQPDTVTVPLGVCEELGDKLGEPVGVAYCVEGTGDGVTVPLPHCVELPDVVTDWLGDKDPLTLALALTVIVLGAEVAAGEEL